MPQLEVCVAGERRTVDLGDSTVIGRSSDVDLLLAIESVSRRHAQIRRSTAGFVLTDLGSCNQTLVNGRQIDAPTILRDGDVIQIATAELVFRQSASALNIVVDMVDATSAPAAAMTSIDATLAKASCGSLQPADALRAVRRVTTLLTSNLALDDLLGQVLDAVFEFCALAERAVLMLLDAAGEVTPVASKARGGASGKIAISRTVLARVVAQKQAVVSTDAAVDERFANSESLTTSPIRSLMCVPLLNQFDEVLGVIEVHSKRFRAFPADALDLMLSIANTAAIAVENARLHTRVLRQDRIERDLELAREVQRSFLPARVPQVAGYEFFAHYEGAFTVSGDYYSFHQLPGDRIAIGIADVSGKGISAALMMARLSSDVRFALQHSQDPAEVLAAVDDSLSESGVDGRFVSMVLMVLDWQQHRLLVANAGHPAPLLRHADGRVEPIRGGRIGVPLNIARDPRLRPTTTSIDIEPGAVILAYTDGISEARDGTQREFGDERILAAMRAADGDAEVVGKQLIGAVNAFTAGTRQRDDTTLVCFGHVASSGDVGVRAQTSSTSRPTERTRMPADMANGSFEIAAPAQPCNLKHLRGFFESVLRQAGVDGVDELLLALDEACANVVRHRCSEADDGLIRVRAELGATDLQLRVLRFCAEDDVPHIKPHDSTDERPGGRGTGLIARIMDRVQYVPQPQAPHLMDLVMTRRRGSAKGGR